MPSTDNKIYPVNPARKSSAGSLSPPKSSADEFRQSVRVVGDMDFENVLDHAHAGVVTSRQAEILVDDSLLGMVSPTR